MPISLPPESSAETGKKRLPRRRTLSRQEWVAAARKVFAGTGVDDVKVDRLARRLGISRGSFYWHFKSRKDLLDALLQDWQTRNHDEMERVRELWRANGPELADVVGVWLSEKPGSPAYDMAMRIWARKSARVADVLHEIDSSWIHLIREYFALTARDPLESLARARVTYFHQVGYYALAMRESLDERIRLGPYYHEILTGRPAGPALDEALARVQAASVISRRTPRKAATADPSRD